MAYEEFPGNISFPVGEHIEVWAAIPGHPTQRRVRGWQPGVAINETSVRLDRGAIVGVTKWRRLKNDE